MTETVSINRKAYQINLSKIDEGFIYSPVYCYASSINEAKKDLLRKIRHDGMRLKYTEDELTYLNIPVIRYPEADLKDFEGKLYCQTEIEDILNKRKRFEYLDGILGDPEITHCYIRKHGSYYRPHSCGYTSFQSHAGIYPKEQAVREGKSVGELQIIPINNQDHNKMIEAEIEDFKTRIIKD